MKQYPIPFKTSAQSVSGIGQLWQTKAAHIDHEIPMAIPPEFDGPGGGFSPEDIYAMALQNCFIATIKVFAEKSKLSYQGIHTEALLEVDRNEKGAPWMARLHMVVRLSGTQQTELAQRVLDKTAQNCMILNSVNTAKTFQFLFD